VNFDFSDEQLQLREAIEQFLAKEYPFERLRIAKSSAAWDPAVWRGLAELGVTAINVPSSLGGLGYGPMETLVLMGACGPSLLLEPVLTSAVIATVLLREFERAEPAAELLRAMAGGGRIAAVAHFEPGTRYDSRRVDTRARRAGEGYRLDGRKSVVMHAGLADTLLVSARARRRR